MNKLRRTVKLVLILAVFLIAGPRTVLAEEMIVDVLAILVGGEAQTEPVDVSQAAVRRAINGNVEPAQAGMRLLVGDEIKTGPGVEVSLVFTKPNSLERIEVFVLENSKAGISSLFGFYGAFLVSGWGIFDTRSKFVRLGKRGTEFEMQVDKSGVVDLKVLRGEVEVEKGEFDPVPPGAIRVDEFLNASYERPGPVLTQTKRTIGGLQSVRIEKDKPIPEPRPLGETEVMSYLQKTNHLYIATMPSRLPTNIRPTTYIPGNDPAENKRRATDAFIKARKDAILNPDANNTKKLGEVYKDFGAGGRSNDEFNKAVKLNPRLMNDFNFLVSSSEAYRLSGNLAESQTRLTKAFTRVQGVDATTKGAARIASGNLAFDKAIVSIARNDRKAAAEFFAESRKAFEAAGTSPIGRKDAVVSNNLNNVKLAINKADPTATVHTGLDGTYRGNMNFPAASLAGNATLVITGNRFTLTHCKRSFDGKILVLNKADGLYDFVFETHAPVAKLTLNFGGTEHARVLASAPGEKHVFNFVQNQTVPAMTCVQINRIARERVL